MNRKITLLMLLTLLIGGLANAQIEKKCGKLTKTVVFSEDFSEGMDEWTIVGEGTDCWSVQNHNYAGGTAPEMFFEWIDGIEFDGDSYCMSPVIDTQGCVALELEFKHLYDTYNEGPSIGVYTTIDDGATWAEVWSTTPYNSVPEIKKITIKNSHVANSNFRFAFKFSGNLYDIWDWAIDDILLVKAQDNDLGVVDIDVQNIVVSGTTLTPKVAVKNFGVSEVSIWSITLTDGDAYTSTVSNINIPFGETKNIEMDNWTPAVGAHTLTATINFAEDGFADNNTLSETVKVVDVISAFAWNVFHNGASGVTGTGPIQIALPTGTMSQIAVNGGNIVAAADYVGNEIYGTRFASDGLYSLVKIDPTSGVVTEIGGGALGLVCFTYDVTTETAYVMNFDGRLGTINLENGFVNNIGGNYAFAIGLACDNQGNLIAISLEGNAAKIDKETGEYTIIGNLGVDMQSIAQDICFDRHNNILYGTLFDNNNGGGLYTIDLTTGAATLLVETVDELAGFAIPYTSNGSSIDNEVAYNSVSVYPNPSDGIVNVNVTEKSVVTVVDLSGRVVASYNVGANETLSFRQASGVYMLKVESEGKVSTHKLIVK